MDAELVFWFDKLLIFLSPILCGVVSVMPERKQKPDFLASPTFEDDSLKDEPIELECGYAISLDSTNETPTIHVKTFGEVDILSLRRKLMQDYPDAKIEGLPSGIPTQVSIKKKRASKTKKSKK